MIRLNWDDVKPILLRDLDARGINKNAVQQRLPTCIYLVFDDRLIHASLVRVWIDS